MRSRRRASLAVLAAATTAGLLAAVVVSAQAGEQTAQPVDLGAARAKTGVSWVAADGSAGPDRGEPDVVTLISGDRVTVSADGKHYSIQRGKGRERIRFASWRVGRELMVVLRTRSGCWPPRAWTPGCSK